jgi:hypothetical protein
VKALATRVEAISAAGLLACSLTLALPAACGPTVAPQEPEGGGGIQRPIEEATPGKVLTTRTGDVCTPGWSSEHREYLRVGEKRQVLAAYGLPSTTKPSEWDHLISLELGGDNGPENIWPMLNHDQDQRKDRLENSLHRQVCDGEISLEQAQREIEEFWRYW